MTILTYDQYFIHVLNALSDGRTQSMGEVRDAVAKATGVSEDERSQRTGSGSPIFAGRVGWAKTYLSKAGLIEKMGYGKYRITERGRAALGSGRPIDLQYLMTFPEFREFVGKEDAELQQDPEEGVHVAGTPDENLQSSLDAINAEVRDELLERVSSLSDAGFERLVVDLLARIYGGEFDKSSEVTGGTGDGGIDGIIKQDRLGFNNIYIQAKKWKGAVGRPEVQKFAGALQGQNATYGAFITSSDFTREARAYADKVNQSAHLVLINGSDLVRLMMEYDVGVITRRTIEIKGIDRDYFSMQE